MASTRLTYALSIRKVTVVEDSDNDPIKECLDDEEFEDVTTTIAMDKLQLDVKAQLKEFTRILDELPELATEDGCRASCHLLRTQSISLGALFGDDIAKIFAEIEGNRETVTDLKKRSLSREESERSPKNDVEELLVASSKAFYGAISTHQKNLMER